MAPPAVPPTGFVLLLGLLHGEFFDLEAAEGGGDVEEIAGIAVADGQGDVTGVVAAATTALEGGIQADPLALDIGLVPGVADEALLAAKLTDISDAHDHLGGNPDGPAQRGGQRSNGADSVPARRRVCQPARGRAIQAYPKQPALHPDR